MFPSFSYRSPRPSRMQANLFGLWKRLYPFGSNDLISYVMRDTFTDLIVSKVMHIVGLNFDQEICH